MVRLHGRLDFTIHEGRDIKDHRVLMDLVDQLVATINSIYPFVNVYLGIDRILRTATQEDRKTPQWNERSVLNVCHEMDVVIVELLDQDVAGNTVLGRMALPAEDLAKGKILDGWFGLGDPDDPSAAVGDFGELRLTVIFVPVQEMELGPDVPDTYFEPRTGCRVELYQDAHQDPGTLPSIPLDGCGTFEARSYWCDVAEAIENAQHFIYVNGWSIDPDVQLVRKPGYPSLGELLKGKAREGVKVVMMVWDDITSIETPFEEAMDGVMGTKDEQTRRCFDDTDVKCFLVAKQLVLGDSQLEKKARAVSFTHHQKAVIVDGPPLSGGSKRGITAFVGGIDLSSGRWDTKEHSLFRTRDGPHKEDFAQRCIPGVTREHGPREPWEDAHCKVEGMAARDVMVAFEQRLRVGVPDEKDCLFVVDEATIELGDEARTNGDKPPGTDWTVQVFSCIDDANAEFGERGVAPNVFHYNGHLVDEGIHRAYVHHIRRARRSLFIENQYFVGSAFAWEEENDVLANNLVPLEICMKICQKIRDSEPFCAYIIIPLFPEGDPSADASQAILHWQARTMQMMYKRIAEVIRETGSSAHPRDYLNFYCLGNRETEEGSPKLTDEAPEKGSMQETVLKSRRMQIYVHAKLMIVDDEYVIVGSANINNRSLAGMRDSELCVGAYQAGHLADNCKPPRGSVYGYRMSLLCEHLGLEEVDPRFRDLHLPETAAEISRMANENWKLYTQEEVVEMRGHLLPYPVDIGDDGEVTELDGCKTFPDFGDKALVAGSRPTLMPSLLTT